MTKSSSKGKGGKKRKDKDAAVSVWREKEFLKGKVVDAGVIILRTSGCSHFHKGGCSMCGYNTESVRDVSADELTKQFSRALSQIGEVQMLKIYTSGSFMDPQEVAPSAAEAMLKESADRDLRLLIESRPEFVISQNLDRILSVHQDIEVAIGLESANDDILRYSVNKGFKVSDYDRSSALLRSAGVDLRTYVLLKPPFLTEQEAMDDAISTARHAASGSASISINAVNVQRGTLVERLWKNWSYRPPWLWSVLTVAKRCADLGPVILCDPVGGGSARGAHNCGTCDSVILDGLKEFTVTQDAGRLPRPRCECEDLWEDIRRLEGFVSGGTPDLQRFFMMRRT